MIHASHLKSEWSVNYAVQFTGILQSSSSKSSSRFTSCKENKWILDIHTNITQNQVQRKILSFKAQVISIYLLMPSLLMPQIVATMHRQHFLMPLTYPDFAPWKEVIYLLTLSLLRPQIAATLCFSHTLTCSMKVKYC